MLAPYREPEEDVIAWLDRAITPTVSRDHDLASPCCVSQKLSQVKIPVMPGAESIGYPPKH